MCRKPNATLNVNNSDWIGFVRSIKSPEQTVNSAQTQRPPLTSDQQDMVERNQKLVWKVMQRIAGVTTQNREDVEQEGYLALCIAVTSYDSARGYKFSTYACRVIELSLWKYINKFGPQSQNNQVSIDMVNDHDINLTIDDTTLDEALELANQDDLRSTLLSYANTAKTETVRRGVNAMILKHLDGLKGREVERRLNMACDTSSTYMSRAKQEILKDECIREELRALCS